MHAQETLTSAQRVGTLGLSTLDQSRVQRRNIDPEWLCAQDLMDEYSCVPDDCHSGNPRSEPDVYEYAAIRVLLLVHESPSRQRDSCQPRQARDTTTDFLTRKLR